LIHFYKRVKAKNYDIKSLFHGELKVDK